MAERIVSPGVFTRENDQTFLPQGIAEISGAFVGPTDKGPAFQPVQITSAQEYRNRFGNGGLYTDIAVQNYLRDAGSALVVRLLGEEGYESEFIEVKLDAATAGISGLTDDVTLAVLTPTQNLTGDLVGASIGSANVLTGFDLVLEIDTSNDGNADEFKTYQVSLNDDDQNYIVDLFGRSPEAVREVYVAAAFPETYAALLKISTSAEVSVFYDDNQLDYTGDAASYRNAETPWIVSQDLLPGQPSVEDRQQLFKFATLSDGTNANREIKVGIENIRYAGTIPGSDYGAFDVVVRAFDDSDRQPEFLEQYRNVNLDPTSPRFLPRVIGNRSSRFTEDGDLRRTGDYENVSEYIRVIMNREFVRANEGGRDDLANLIPWGYDSYQIPLDFDGNLPHGVKARQFQSVQDVDYDIFPGGLSPQVPADEDALGATDTRVFFGFDFDWEANLNYLAPIGNNGDSPGDQPSSLEYGFTLSDVYVVNDSTGLLQQPQFGTSEISLSERKFILGFQGGFDGLDATKAANLGEDITNTNTQGLDASAFNSPGTLAYEKALGILENDDQFDINLLVTPGILNDLHPAVVERGIRLCEERSDCFYILDPAGVDASISSAIQSIETLDTNYAGTYYPWLRIRDTETNRLIEVPPSVLMPRVYAFNDRNAAEWFAPAGLNRGGIPEAIEAVNSLTKDERDLLYQDRINPIASFPDQGVVSFGQKTLQAIPSALDRINVRRLLIAVKKFIASTSRFLVFEQNVPATRNRFLNIVRPFLNQVQQRNGLFAFRVQMDADNNPPEVVDRNQLRGEIFLQPARAAEFIVLDFNVLPTGASFDDA